MAELRKYGIETRIYFPLVDFGDSDYQAGVTIAAGDATISKDGGSFVNVVGESDDDLFLGVGNGLYSLKVAAAELQCQTAVIRIVDQDSTKEWEDQMVLINTYGNVSAQILSDLDRPATENLGRVSRDRALVATVNFHLRDASTNDFYDGALNAGDVTISKDEGAWATANDNPPSKDQTNLYSIDLTASEMTASRIDIRIIDATNTPKLFADALIHIETDTQQAGGYSCTVTIRDTDFAVIEGATVWPSLNTSGTPAYATSKVTNSAGEATFWLPDGTYYFFATGAGYSYPNAGGESLTVSGASTSATFDIGTLVSGSVGGTSADTFLTRTVADVRLATDEPTVNAKYTDANIISFIEQAYTSVLGEMQRNENTHIVAEYTITYVADQEYYLLPGTAGTIISIGYKDATYGTKFFYEKGGHLSEFGTRVTIENNFLRIQPRVLTGGDIITVCYLPSGCAKLFSASTTTYTAGSITFDSGSLDEGSRDVRPYAYVGSTLRILPDANNIVQQERIITGQSGDDYNVFEVSPDFSPVLESTAVFEIYPSLPIELDAAVTLKVAMRMLMTEGDRRRFAMMQTLYSDALRTLQLAAANKDYTHGVQGRRDGFQRRRRRGGPLL